ncbi:MAG: hypothetical protein V3T17_09155, partial [Pseudomonadales bacterium]
MWLAPLLLFLVLPIATWGRIKSDPFYSNLLIFSGLGGLGYLLAQGFAIGISGWEFTVFESIFGPMDDRQFGLGYGALFVSASFLFALTQGIAARGAINGDVFVVSAIGLVVAVVTVFVFFPVLQILTSALRDNEGVYSLATFLTKFT